MAEDDWAKKKKKEGKELQSEEVPTKKRKLDHSNKEKGRPLPPPIQRDKGEAQYHFSSETINFLVNLLKDVGIHRVLCVGVPSLHQFIWKNVTCGLKSFLLDIDTRLTKNVDSAAQYNMCNHHFFSSEEKMKYQKFIDVDSDEEREKIALIIDPPFGAKVDVLWNGALKHIQADCYESNHITCEVVWIFPYFMEGHILSSCPAQCRLRMSDYVITYSNHPKFKEQQNNKKKPSPVRFFTTVPLSSIKLPEELYRYCIICQKWVQQDNLHCNICKACPTKDGGKTYVHCTKCKKCVKSTWFHCALCGSCHLENTDCKSISSNNDDELVESQMAHSSHRNNKQMIGRQKRSLNVQRKKKRGLKNKTE